VDDGVSLGGSGVWAGGIAVNVGKSVVVGDGVTVDRGVGVIVCV
jgi:hypothetical protein